MKNLKLLLIVSIAFAFTACNKCKECTPENNEFLSHNGETIVRPNEEICSDNFESNKDFKNFIEEKEEQGYECKSDLWN